MFDSVHWILVAMAWLLVAGGSMLVSFAVMAVFNVDINKVLDKLTGAK